MKKSEIKSVANTPLTKSTNQFPVVGVGASAGGLQAFKALLKAIPTDSGMAYVLVQHLDPTHESMLPELLQKVTSIPVLEITDDIKVQPDHIYIIPSNKIMIANDGVLRLTTRPNVGENKRNMPIDLFFQSLAEVHQNHSIGVILSGNGSDGTVGLQAIQSQGGLTFAQDSESAQNRDMPHNAIQAGVVDFILSPQKMLQKLLDIAKITNDEGAQEISTSTQQSDEAVFNKILSVIRIRKGTDFTFYKKNTIYRRVLRRMALSKNEEPAAYLNYLRTNKGEQDALYQDFLIPVTEFFRDKESFDYLCTDILSKIIKIKTKNEPIRIWIAGCSTGQEAFSIAMCIKEFYDTSTRLVQIFGTDISEPAITKARAGIYSKTDMEGISSERLKEFFVKNNGGYQVSKQIREMCVFAVHNFLQDPPFGKMDLVSCRNVLIYMKRFLQKKAFTTFHYALNLKGFLLLGKTETASSVQDLFTSVNKGHKLFVRKDVPTKYMHVSTPRREQILQENDAEGHEENISTDFRKAADEIVLKKYMPVGVIVNELFDIVNYRGKTADYLEQVDGIPSHNLLKLAKGDLSFELRALLHKTKKEKTSITKKHVSFNENLPAGQKGAHRRNITIEAIPLNTVEPHYLILFHENPELKPQIKKSAVGSKQDHKDLLINQLEEQLMQTHADMRSISDEQEIVIEELQSSNEELLSSSEELHSLNEELETSKEELQSTNEELTVVNQEMISLNEHITEARDYSEAIVSTVHSALIVLDKYFRVKFANRSFYKIFAVHEEETENVILFDLGNRQWNIPRLREFLEVILPENSHFNDFEVRHNFPDIGEKIMILNARRIQQKNPTDELILLSIKDITQEATERKKVEESKKNLHNLIYSSPSAIGFLKGNDMVIETANDAILKMWGKDKDVIGRKFFEVLPELVDQCYPQIFAAVYKTGEPYNALEAPIRLMRNGKLKLKYYNIVVYPQYNLNNKVEGVGIIAFEVTSEALINQHIKESEENFRSLSQTLPQLIWVTDAEGNLEFLSSRWKEYSGIEPRTKNEWKKIVHPEDYEQVNAYWESSLSKEKVYQTEVRLKNKKGEFKWHSGAAVPVYDNQKNILKWVGACTDIHGQKIKEEKKDEFLNIASHEMKTPLTTAKAYIQMLEHSLDEKEEAQLFVKKASQSIDRLNDLINELLDVSKIQFGKLNYTVTTFDFNAMVDTTVESIQLTAPTCSIIKSGKVESEVTGDRDRLQQVIINLLSNAMKYSPNSAEVFIDISQKKERVSVSVRDTGIGIGKESLRKIFEKYHRIEEHAVKFQGMGIGLFISYEIVKRHHGKMWVESEIGKGTIFHFSVPIITKTTNT